MTQHMKAHNPQDYPLIFMGTPAFAVPALEGLKERGYPILGVLTQAPKPKGRGMKAQKSAVHQAAERLGLCVDTPQRFNTHVFENLKTLAPCLIVVAAYGLLLPPPVLSLPRFGCLNLHASLLPRWRGAAPIQRAIMAGDTQTGITLMQMDRGMDTGGMFAKQSIEITPHDTGCTVFEKLAIAAKTCLLENVPLILEEKLQATAQPKEGVTYAPKITAEETCIDWQQPADAIERLIRALCPKVFFYHQGKRFRILDASVEDRPITSSGVGQPGDLLDTKLLIACGKGALRPQRLQSEGKAPLCLKDFLNGHGALFAQGTSLDAAA